MVEITKRSIEFHPGEYCKIGTAFHYLNCLMVPFSPFPFHKKDPQAKISRGHTAFARWASRMVDGNDLGYYYGYFR